MNLIHENEDLFREETPDRNLLAMFLQDDGASRQSFYTKHFRALNKADADELCPEPSRGNGVNSKPHSAF